MSARIAPLLRVSISSESLHGGRVVSPRQKSAAAAAAGAFLLGQFIENDFKEEKAKEYRAGYDLGRANSIKELYWLTQQLHRAQDGDQPQMQMYELPVQYPADGAKYVPDTVYLPVVK